MYSVYYVVRKSFKHGERTLTAGEVVDIKTWKNAKKLESTRYITKLYGTPATCKECGLMFENEERLAKHIKQVHPMPAVQEKDVEPPPIPPLEDVEAPPTAKVVKVIAK